ncbi:MAG: carbon-nitrogen family hydrolase [Oscillospiraceae bacterium]|nr:carbon-nitrogen family hydrolase [Oscillospiraceae bacterium]
MKISCIQMDMRLGEPDCNFAHAEELVRAAVRAERPDVVVLPETWNTGFFPKNLSACADRDGERTKAVFSAMAKELNVNIVCGSVANKKADGFYNTAYVFDRTGGVIAEYDKTHLFTPSGEHEHFRSGTHACRFELDGKKCGLIICYDIRFPELTRTMTLEGVDLLFVVAQWPEKRTMHLETLARARAIENQMFLALCNSVGAAGETRCGGHSAIIDPWGEYLARAWDGEETITGEADFSVIEGIRSSINVFRDRRPELYAVN